MLSQEDTVKLPMSIARNVALDLVELDELRSSKIVYLSIIGNYKNQIKEYSDQSILRTNQNALLQKNIDILESQLKVEKKVKRSSNAIPWILGVVSAGGIGYFIGTIN